MIIGVGDIRSGGDGAPVQSREPLAMIADTTAAALAHHRVPDIGPRVDTIYAAKTTSWAQDDLPNLIAARTHRGPRRVRSVGTGPPAHAWTASVRPTSDHAISIGTLAKPRATALSLLVGAEAGEI